MRRRLIQIGLIVLAIASLSGTSKAAPGGCMDPNASLNPFAFEQITVSSTAVGFTTATFAPSGSGKADMAVVDVETNAIRYRADGLNPTAAVGSPIAASGSFTVCGQASIQVVRFIRQTADATLDVHYYRVGQ